jgi:hypothetical protein
MDRQETQMLILVLNAGESVLAQGNWQLFHRGRSRVGAELEMVSLTRATLSISQAGGGVVVHGLRPLMPQRVTATAGSTLRIGESVIKCEFRDDGRLKVAIDAPQHVRLTRPAQHGGALLAS